MQAKNNSQPAQQIDRKDSIFINDITDSFHFIIKEDNYSKSSVLT